MRLRIAELKNGTYVIQRMKLGYWTLATEITDAAFDTFAEAETEAKRALVQHEKSKLGKDVVEVWEVSL